MCGICGIVREQPGELDLSLAEQMAGTMVHRGPDDQGVASFPGAVLGFRRLSIIDVQGSHQPLHNENKTVWCMCNGEIYNYLEIREQLLGLGQILRRTK